jgi:hypothetical protein
VNPFRGRAVLHVSIDNTNQPLTGIANLPNNILRQGGQVTATPVV